MAENTLITQILAAVGVRVSVPQKQPTLTRKRTGWWGKLSDAADRRVFNWKTREALYVHLSTQVENGVSVEDALDGYAEIMRKRKRKSSAMLVANVSRRMREGMPLRRAIEIAIPREEAALLAGGEMSGKLGVALDLLVDSHDRVESVVRAYKEAARRPIIYFAMTYAVMWGVGFYVMPDITRGLPENKVHGLGVVMYQTAHLSQSLWAIAPPLVCIASFYAVRASLPRWTGPNRIKAEGYFPYSFYRDIEGYKWLSSFAALIEAGIADVDALARQMETASPWLRERLKHIRFRMTEGGMKLAEALEARGANGKMPPFEFPNPTINDRIRSIASFKGFHERVGRLTRRWSEEIERNALAQARRAGFIAEASMYVMMGFLMLAINSVTTQLGQIGGT